MKRKKSRRHALLKKSLERIIPYVRIAIGALALILMFILAFDSINETKAVSEVEASAADVLGAYDSLAQNKIYVESPNGVEIELKIPSEEEVVQAEERYAEKLRKIEEEKKRKEEEERQRRLQKIQPLQNFLYRMGSPMAPYAELILNSCEKYGIHYCKIYLSLAGVESGFGRIPIGCCNAWGLMGVKYPSWEVAIPKASDWIAQNYYLRGVNTIEKLAYSSYGPLNPEKWIQDLYFYYNQIPLY
ncbi:hypothetical protein JW766_03755 [Candidatus Dojkabacteria bacterium]|nr:hypothetical protein [Candidatus Dojkabacteria bacterium]